MKTKTLLAIVALLVAACEPSVDSRAQHTEVMQTIPELRGCKTFRVSDGVTPIYITRCPASEAISSSTSGKNQTHSSLIIDDMTVMDSQSAPLR